jgi:hypothetical protein
MTLEIALETAGKRYLIPCGTRVAPRHPRGTGEGEPGWFSDLRHDVEIL